MKEILKTYRVCYDSSINENISDLKTYISALKKKFSSTLSVTNPLIRYEIIFIITHEKKSRAHSNASAVPTESCGGSKHVQHAPVHTLILNDWMSWFALFRLLTARGKVIVKWYYSPWTPKEMDTGSRVRCRVATRDYRCFEIVSLLFKPTVMMQKCKVPQQLH